MKPYMHGSYSKEQLAHQLQLSDKQILASVVGQSSVEDESRDEEDDTDGETKQCGSYSTYAASKNDGISDTYML